jgi:hypothetical protein
MEDQEYKQESEPYIPDNSEPNTYGEVVYPSRSDSPLGNKWRH